MKKKINKSIVYMLILTIAVISVFSVLFQLDTSNTNAAFTGYGSDLSLEQILAESNTYELESAGYAPNYNVSYDLDSPNGKFVMRPIVKGVKGVKGTSDCGKTIFVGKDQEKYFLLSGENRKEIVKYNKLSKMAGKIDDCPLLSSSRLWITLNLFRLYARKISAA